MIPSAWIFKNQYEFKIVESLITDSNFKELLNIMGGPPPWEELLAQEEREKHERLKDATKSLKRLRIGVYFKNQLIAFTFAFQSEGSNLHMAMSCVHPEHQRQGIYTELLRAVLEYSKSEGFQTVDSYHRATNNPVIIAKLRSGFVINGFTLSDIMGCLVRTTYFHNTERRKLMDIRSGLVRPQGPIKELFF
jgi:ribosomal protein S18 acetylase RimI-like enzyme